MYILKIRVCRKIICSHGTSVIISQYHMEVAKIIANSHKLTCHQGTLNAAERH